MFHGYSGLSTAPRRKGYDLGFSVFHEFSDMFTPTLQSCAFLGCVNGAIVNTSNSSLMTRNVIEHSFDDMGLYTDVRHPCCNSAANVVDAPRRDLICSFSKVFDAGSVYAVVEGSFCAAPSTEAPGGLLRN